MKCGKIVCLLCVLVFAVLFNQSVFSQDNSEDFLKATMLGETKSVQMLIDAGADVNAQTNDGETALQRAEKINEAALADMTEIIEMLKESGAK